ncbi:VTT domain-containing protein [Phytohabitans sp. ZYX-F-186]|uniref:VTT domain-containing protein n=1 Tax=Phytohabitans maris TaxID=3071409 RepID=A0ABU0ZSV9_9ACTN|nr:VTT domain-containing protein [Phytohabitans sp. ZYX-F-186]MDQ7910060.1 VTT domain-containing protein [Phytohabitans sp. ZYX-F-186]
MADLLTSVASPLTAYLLLMALLAVDAFVPVVPTQALMITVGALTVYGDLSLPITIAVGALGVFGGDLVCYLLGRSAREPGAQPEAPARGRARKAAIRFTRGLRRPGPMVILLCRFVPGGRMAACFQAGRVRYPVRLFVAYEGAAALLWAAYGGLVGHIGGSALTQSAWRLVAVAAVAAAIFAAAGWILALAGSAPTPTEQADATQA